VVERAREIEMFLDDAGWAGAVVTPLAADASFRRYDRVMLNDRRAVLMDAPPPQEDTRPFIRVAKYLTQMGFSAPRIMSEDPERGFLLLEDMGDDTYTRVLADDGDARALYATAIDTLIQLHEVSAPSNIPAGTPPYDMDALLKEVMLFVDWYLPAITNEKTSPALRASYEAAWRSAFIHVADARETLVLRDYHVDNLMWLPDRNSTERCGLLDFQDAVVGARAYDVMSLIEDARRDIPDMIREEMISRYLDVFPDLSGADLRRDIAILGAGRHAKVIGIFTRLSARDYKSQYLHHISRVWRLLERDLMHPALSDVADWFNQNVPHDLRRIPAASDAA
jgi:aminoglycoside/choline kinase family phosphotransferase